MILIDRNLLPEPQNIIYALDNDLDIKFEGWVIGIGDHGYGPLQGFKHDTHLRGVRVEIGLTVNGNLIAWVKRYDKSNDACDATIGETPDDILAWLRKDSGGKLGPATKKAWAQACEYGPLKAYAFQEVS